MACTYIFPTYLSIAETQPKPIQIIKTTVKAECNAFRPIVEKYDWDVETALKIMQAESGCIPTNHNYNDIHRNWKTGEVICRGSYGLMQIGCIHFQGESKDIPEVNIAMAYKVYQGSGWKAWTTYKKVL